MYICGGFCVIVEILCVIVENLSVFVYMFYCEFVEVLVYLCRFCVYL